MLFSQPFREKESSCSNTPQEPIHNFVFNSYYSIIAHLNKKSKRQRSGAPTARLSFICGGDTPPPPPRPSDRKNKERKKSGRRKKRKGKNNCQSEAAAFFSFSFFSGFFQTKKPLSSVFLRIVSLGYLKHTTPLEFVK